MTPERRRFYPKDWKQQADACREQAGNQCQHCQVRQGTQRISRRTNLSYTVYLHAAHKNHDLENPKPVLLCLCPSCHGKYDYEHMQATDTVTFEKMRHAILLSRRGR